MIYVITNRKGSSGTTTLAVGLANVCAQAQRTLLIDLDTQGDPSSWLGIEATGEALADALSGKARLDAAIRPAACGVDVAPAGEALGYIVNSVRRASVRRALESVARHRYGSIVIHCPPGLSPLVVSAWQAAADGLAIVPIDGPSAWRAAGRLRQAWCEAGLDPRRLRAVLSRFNGRRIVDRALARQTRERADSWVLPTPIRESVIVQEASACRRPLLLHAPRHPVTHDLRSFTQEVTHAQA